MDHAAFRPAAGRRKTQGLRGSKAPRSSTMSDGASQLSTSSFCCIIEDLPRSAASKQDGETVPFNIFWQPLTDFLGIPSAG